MKSRRRVVFFGLASQFYTSTIPIKQQYLIDIIQFYFYSRSEGLEITRMKGVRIRGYQTVVLEITPLTPPVTH